MRSAGGNPKQWDCHSRWTRFRGPVKGTFDGPEAKSLGTASGEHWFVSRWYADNLVEYWNGVPFSAWDLRVEQHRTFEEYLADVSPKHIPPTLMERLRSTSAHRYSRVMWWVRKVAAHWRDWVPIALSAATLATVLLS